MPDLEVLMPWRDCGDDARRTSMGILTEYYAQVGRVILGDSDPSRPFNLSEARNAAAAEGSADVCVFIDADALVDLDVLVSAVQLAGRRQRLVRPFARAGFLTQRATEAFWSQRRVVWEEWIEPPEPGFCGLAWVVRRGMFEELGGFDPGFQGYGGEDNAFQAACELVGGPQMTMSGTAYSLWHSGEGRVTSEANWERARAYWSMSSLDDYRRLRSDVDWGGRAS